MCVTMHFSAAETLLIGEGEPLFYWPRKTTRLWII